jgi:pimeloyl-ACP methyl ester carboxylesterase/predicted glycosyltransferase
VTAAGLSGTASAGAVAPAAAVGAPENEQTRALYPEQDGFVERDGVRIFYEVYGHGDPTVLLLPSWSAVHSRLWKFQIPYLARHCRVLTFDGRGNGRSDRPAGAEAYRPVEFADDALAVLDVTGTARAHLVSLSCGAVWATILAADHPDRVAGSAYISPAAPLVPGHPERAVYPFDEPVDATDGWAKYNRHYWSEHYLEFLDWFFQKCLNEPHSAKAIEDCIGWGLDTTPRALGDATLGMALPFAEPFADTCARVRCPTLVLHGDQDLIRPLAQGAALAQATGGRLVTLEGSGHIPSARDPVRINLLLRDFIAPPPAPARWRRAGGRQRRALYVSSPIGLGHARRDAAIADELRRLVPDLEIDWLAQHPVTAALQARGERIHPASVQLAGESAHIQSEASGHELPVFEALRRMDEILVANFMVFHDVVRQERYDLWIGDEAWDLDYFLHENPELKTAPYAWLTDFVGYLPTPEGGPREAFLTADLNAEMVAQIARYPRVRDRSIFVGEPGDVVGDSFGPGLPAIRQWTEEHFSFSGYVTGFDPAALGDRAALRRELGYGAGEPVCIVTVGGSGVGEPLLRRIIAALPEARRQVSGLRMIVVAGPRIDPANLPSAPGLELRAYVPDLHRHLAACDLAIVQGGLTTTMELTAARTPFIYFPLRRHFEQNGHVHHRLQRYHAGRRMDFDAATPVAVADAIAQEIGRPVDYLPVPSGGAARAAALIAPLLA